MKSNVLMIGMGRVCGRVTLVGTISSCTRRWPSSSSTPTQTTTSHKSTWRVRCLKSAEGRVPDSQKPGGLKIVSSNRSSLPTLPCITHPAYTWTSVSIGTHLNTTVSNHSLRIAIISVSLQCNLKQLILMYNFHNSTQFNTSCWSWTCLSCDKSWSGFRGLHMFSICESTRRNTRRQSSTSWNGRWAPLKRRKSWKRR